MGNRDGIDEMSSTNASVLLSVLKLIDKYDLYGQVAYPKHHKQFEVPDIYRLAAKTKVTYVVNVYINFIDGLMFWSTSILNLLFSVWSLSCFKTLANCQVCCIDCVLLMSKSYL